MDAVNNYTVAELVEALKADESWEPDPDQRELLVDLLMIQLASWV